MSAYLTALAEAGTREDLLAQIARLTEDRARTAALHSARMTELLEANNREVEKRRIAERALEATSFQTRVGHWMQACFGPAISADRLERGDRLLEEVLELLQSGGFPPERVTALKDYVWSRPAGHPPQEVGGVEVTLAAYCLAHEIDMHLAGETELARIWTKVAAIRAKQAAKPTGSALPMEWPQTTTAQVSVVESAAHKLASAVLNYYDCDDDAARPARFDEMIDLAKAISNSSEVALAHTPAPQRCSTCGGKGYAQEWMGDDQGAAITSCMFCGGSGKAPQPGGVKVKARPIDLATMLKHAWIAGKTGTAWEDYDPTELIVYQRLAAALDIPLPTQPEKTETMGKIYIASKTGHGPLWRRMRDQGVPIISTWIDEAEAGATSDWPDLWTRCVAEAATCSALIVYRQHGEELKGGWVEVGAALAAGRPVYGVGVDEFSIRHHPNFHQVDTLFEAVRAALSHTKPITVKEA